MEPIEFEGSGGNSEEDVDTSTEGAIDGTVEREIVDFMKANEECTNGINKGQVGKPLMTNKATKLREKVNFPRVLVEVSIEKEFPDKIQFEDERNRIIEVMIGYEWKPEKCNHCQGVEGDDGFQLVNKGVKAKDRFKEKLQGVISTNPFQALSGNEEGESSKTQEENAKRGGEGEPPLTNV
ncbi:unnamed protein product [Vicia faba]|uniref:Uncharacterized protein n=1 Tax=Vicia faba TaxID=3906 RepID=A0AAV0YAP5_VICFA|nr:unnamed protein product [Vicia faba]